MIITISGANFSLSNIGTLSTWTVSKSIGAGAEHNIPSYVDKNSAFNYEITLKDGYTFGTYSVTMGGQKITPTVTETSMTINIPSVTGAVRIEVKTINSSTGEEDKPVTPPVTPEQPGTGGGSGNDVIVTFSDYKIYAGCVSGSTNSFQYSGNSSEGYKGNTFYQLPLSDFNNPTSVTVVAGSTKAYVTFFTEKITKEYDGGTVPYAGSLSAQTIMEPSTTQTFNIPSNATHMYVLKTNGAGSSLMPSSVTFHNAVYNGSSDKPSGSGSGSGSGSTTTKTENNYFGVKWTIGYAISSSGSMASQPTYAASDVITRDGNKNLKYIPYSGDKLWLTVSTYNGDTFINRQTFDPAVYTSETVITLENNATKIRLGYGRSSSTNIDMKEADMANLNISWM